MKFVLSILSVAAAAFAQPAAKLPVTVTLPAPFATPSSTNNARVVGRPDGAKLSLPEGFQIEEYLTDFEVPRFMMLGPNKELLISDAGDKGTGCVWVVVGKEKKKLISGLTRPYGLALWHDYLYVGEPTAISRYRYDAKTMTTGPPVEIIGFDADFAKGHWTRSILFDRKEEKMYIGTGSASNVDAGENPLRAAINRYNPNGSAHEIFASGTRNPIGLHWYPGTDTLWAAVQERDGLGDDLVPDYFTHIQAGKFYGWPFAYAGPNEDPRRKGENPALVAKTVKGDVLLPAHVAVLDFTFYTGKMFPKQYQGGAFLALHGSWNRSQRIGYEVAFVPFAAGKPTGPAQDFLTGWMTDPNIREVWGRPVAVFEMPDGSLLVSDDGGKKIWRISYKP